MQIYTENGRKHRKLAAGESFGEIHLVTKNLSQFRATAVVDCEVLLFRRFHFQQLCREHGKRHMEEAMIHMKDVARRAAQTIATNKPQAVVRSFSIGFTDSDGETLFDGSCLRISYIIIPKLIFIYVMFLCR